VQGIRGVISTLTNDGQEVMGPGVLVWHYPDNSIVNNSLLTVESNHNAAGPLRCPNLQSGARSA